MMGNLVYVYAEDVIVGDKLFGVWEVIAVQRADNFGNPALQFTLPDKQGRLIVNTDVSIPISE